MKTFLNRLNRLFVICLAVCTALASLAGCGPKNSPGGPPSSAQPSSAADSSPKLIDTTGMDPLSEEYDKAVEENALAKCTTPDYFKNTPAYEYSVEFNVAPNENSFGQRYFEKKFNVKLNYIHIDEGGDRREQLNLKIATGTIPDVAKVSLPEISLYTKQGILAEVPEETIRKNMPGYYKILQDYDPNLLKYTKIDGKNMGLAGISVYGGIPRAAVIRSDWLKNVGIGKVPATLDELGDAFLKFRNNDPDQNGKKDTYALSCPSDWDGDLWFQSVFGAYGTNPFMWLEKDGKLQYGFTMPETKDALKLLNKWYSEEIIDPEFITDKARNSETEDIATKFAKGKLGYLDHLNFDDHQWDNDGHISYRWFANNPAWSKWWEENKDDQNKLYGTKVFTDFDDSVPQPIYIDMPPVTGPDGKSGYNQAGYLSFVFMFGKQLEEDPQKLEKLLKILEYENQDEETYLMLGAGPEGENWITGKDGVKLLNPDWTKHKHYHPQFKIVGTCWTTLPMYWTNPDYISIVGGPRAEQRSERTADIIKKFPSYENKVKVSLPSQAKYAELTDTRIKEYIIKAITGDIDIDSTFDDMVGRWSKDGGDALTKEANEWYDSIK